MTWFHCFLHILTSILHFQIGLCQPLYLTWLPPHLPLIALTNHLFIPFGKPIIIYKYQKYFIIFLLTKMQDHWGYFFISINFNKAWYTVGTHYIFFEWKKMNILLSFCTYVDISASTKKPHIFMSYKICQKNFQNVNLPLAFSEGNCSILLEWMNTRKKEILRILKRLLHAGSELNQNPREPKCRYGPLIKVGLMVVKWYIFVSIILA